MMSSRIQELAQQAGYKADMFGVGHWDMPECKKFAELIVRECCQKLEDDGMVEVAMEIKQHFGVES